MSTPAVEQGVRTFYSRTPGLHFWAWKRPQRIESEGQKLIEDGPEVQFHPIGDGWGQLFTSDPEVIKACEARHDVVGPEIFNRDSKPVEMRLNESETARDALVRKIEEQNRLIERLKSGSKT